MYKFTTKRAELHIRIIVTYYKHKKERDEPHIVSSNSMKHIYNTALQKAE